MAQGVENESCDESLRRYRNVARTATRGGGGVLHQLWKAVECQAEEVRPYSTLTGKPLKTLEEE